MSEKTDKSIALTREQRIIAVETDERQQAAREIRQVREKLEDFSVRDFAEAFYGEEFTDIVYGKEGGTTRMGDLKMSTEVKGNGEVGFKLDDEQLVALMKQAHPTLSDVDIRVLLTSSSPEVRRIQNEAMDGHAAKVKEDHEKAFDDFQKQMLEDIRNPRKDSE